MCFWGNNSSEQCHIVSSMATKKLVRQEYEVYVCYVMEDIKNETKLEDILVVREFSDVFPEEIPRLPPKREIDFEIELEPGVCPSSKPPYKMALAKLKELKV